MSYRIRKAAVIGSGTMGAGIAALLAGVGVETVLLDIPAPDTEPGDPLDRRNAVVRQGVERLKTSRPAQLYSQSDLSLIRTGNIDDDLDMIGDADWVVEVVVEKLDVKQNLMAQLAEAAKPDAIITTNTSGLPINQIADGLGKDFTRRFLGTHFFNPPRYLYLLEVIPHADTDPEIVRSISEFATRRLGKGVVLCKDKPNFIGNRFMSMAGSQVVNYALDHGFTVEEVDALTGPLIGRPKTASFRLFDLVGIDIAVHVGENLYPLLPDDPAREVLRHPKAQVMFSRMMKEGWLGNKTGQGFYKAMTGADGQKEFWVLNPDTFEYQPPSKPRFDSVGKHRKVEDTGERIRLLMNEDDRAAQFIWHLHAFYLAYASNRVPEITETIVNVDNAQKWGFSHELGPFEIWDTIGVDETIPAFIEAGYPVSDWVKEMVDSGFSTFYSYADHGQKVAYYSPQEGHYLPLEQDERVITVEALRAPRVTVAVSPEASVPKPVTDSLRQTSTGEVARNAGASILDMGDGVALLEFHSTQNTIDPDVIEMTWKALELLDKGAFQALVIGNDGERFCIGANIFFVAMAAQQGQLADLEQSVKASQDMMMALRYAPRPVVTAPFNMALGGGAEFLMAGALTVAHVELYAGQVEVGVGLVPGSGGCKELLRRVVNPVMAVPNADVLPPLQKVFETIALAKVSLSAKEAREIGFLGLSDKIVMNRAHLLWEAKQAALHLAEGYIPRKPEKIWAAGRDAYAALLIGIEAFREGRFATEHDALIARKLAYILTGGALAEPQWVDEQYILNLEREAFLSLVQEPRTQERIAHMLQYNKPLRN